MTLIGQRLINQRIAGERLATPAEIVRWLGAVQAQDYHQCLWAVGSRLPTPSLAAVEAAIADGSILRTWPMRGTIHFVPPEDARWMLKLCGERLLAMDARRLGQLELSYADIEQTYTWIQAALSGGKRMTRGDLLDLIERNGISTKGGRGYHILWHSAQSGLICLGPMQDKEQTFALLDDWAPQQRALSTDEALAELARRYVVSHAPVTVYDFARWTGMTITEARKGLEGAAGDLVKEKIDGVEYWQPASPLPPVDTDESVYLLAGFDEYFIGYKDREAIVAPEFATHIVPGANGIFKPLLVIGGRVVGTWARTVKKKGVTITISPFAAIDGLAERVSAPAREYAEYLGVPLGEMKVESQT